MVTASHIFYNHQIVRIVHAAECYSSIGLKLQWKITVLGLPGRFVNNVPGNREYLESRPGQQFTVSAEDASFLGKLYGN